MKRSLAVATIALLVAAENAAPTRPELEKRKKQNEKALAVIILTCLTTSLYADLGDDYNTCLKQLEKTGMPVNHDDINGYPRLEAHVSGIQHITLFFNKAKTRCILEEIVSPAPIQVNAIKVTLARYHKHWKIDNIDDSNVWAESTDGEIYVSFYLKRPAVFRIANREARQSPMLVNWPNRENPEKESMLFP